ncbi:MAG: right-handed parallel beta-helix repeat-containing protein [Planctomycetes bacterium]|nr:right-handed parallel beta-helix repeat-containing protein [Planctomycetota bacterium]
MLPLVALLAAGAAAIYVFRFPAAERAEVAPPVAVRPAAATDPTPPPDPAPAAPAASLDAAGWTAFRDAEGSRSIYVSSSQGDDERDGLAPERAKRTIAAGYALVRDGRGDRLLLRRGDSWDEAIGLISKSGRSAESPQLIASYGESGDPPLLRTGDRSAAWLFKEKVPPVVRHVAIVGIDFAASARDPSAPGFAPPRELTVGLFVLHRIENLLVEACRFSWYGQGLAITGEGEGHRDVRIRRCVVIDSYAVAGHAQGMFFSKVDALLLEENILDHNGWNEKVAGAVPNIFRHGIYIYQDCGGVVLRGNIVARSASHGCQARTGGTIEGNLFVENAIGLYFTTGGAMSGNVVLDSRDISAGEPRGIGIELRGIGERGATISENLVARTQSRGPRAGILLDSTGGTSIRNVTLAQNTVCDAGVAVEIQGSDFEGVRFEQNRFVQRDRSLKSLVVATEAPRGGIRFAGNRYFAAVPESRWFAAGSRRLSFAEWVRLAEESDAEKDTARFADAERTLATYQASLGREKTVASFFAEIRKQTRHNWRAEYTAAKVNAYLRAGFQPAEQEPK